jgi:hypothetical protein
MLQLFTPSVRATSTHWIEGLDRSQSWSGCSGEEKKSHHCPCWELNSGCPAHNLVPTLTVLPKLNVDWTGFETYYIYLIAFDVNLLQNANGMLIKNDGLIRYSHLLLWVMEALKRTIRSQTGNFWNVPHIINNLHMNINCYIFSVFVKLL